MASHSGAVAAQHAGRRDHFAWSASTILMASIRWSGKSPFRLRVATTSGRSLVATATLGRSLALLRLGPAGPFPDDHAAGLDSVSRDHQVLEVLTQRLD